MFNRFRVLSRDYDRMLLIGYTHRSIQISTPILLNVKSKSGDGGEDSDKKRSRTKEEEKMDI